MQKDILQLTEAEIEGQKRFNSPSLGPITFKELIYQIGLFMHEKPKNVYEIVVGSDSQAYTERVDFVSAIIVHRKGEGGIYFWQRNRDTDQKYYLRDRMYQEALLSINLAQEFMNQFHTEGMIRFDVEIHVDIGENGRTREMIGEVVGMVRGNGFNCRTKPQAYGAASVADRYT